MELPQDIPNLALPLRFDAQGAAFDLFVVYDARREVVATLDDYEDAFEFVARANGVEHEDVRQQVAQTTRMLAEYMSNLKQKRRVGSESTSSSASSTTEIAQSSQREAAAVDAARQLLDITSRGEAPRSLELVLRALQGSDDAEQYAFYLGKPRRPISELWGDNDQSFVAEICPVKLSEDERAFLVVLTQDGGISQYLGSFPTEQAALHCLAQKGRFERP